MGARIAVSVNVCLNRWNTQKVEEEATFEALIQNSLIESKHLSNTSASDKRRQVMHHFVRQKDFILNTLHIYTPDNIRELLDRDDHPSFQDLVALDWTSLTLYILDPQQTEMEDYQPEDIHMTTHPSRSKSHSIPILFMETLNGLANSMSIVAEAVYADIFGAYSDHIKDKSLHQTVYGDSRKVFSWHGACSHFCLLEGVRGLKNITIKGQHLIDTMFKYMKLVTDNMDETVISNAKDDPATCKVKDSDNPDEIKDADNLHDIDNIQTITDPNIDQIEITALSQIQLKTFTRIEDPAMITKRLRAKRQHATYVRWIEKMTRLFASGSSDRVTKSEIIGKDLDMDMVGESRGSNGL
ncbi:hypothetical protein ASPVEDRAFT_894330 [Aspergillus versicolor CBS 583.65]|uniref:Uncharacterized protein n=1 Tax=Aspergillus versicolor CBS 583.65 TaxID=1036611 RepID=A0A1L9PVN2_ASPVE|nr:uncharacterized protein ASPVEDRAFT_894330 [Aspergillus versicolor CBS 583.65]OJJ05486.1 hypothetical protein ASPVEDRAFT_894330 [Aspergillus versicolor CBS 583.65]